MHLSRRRLLTAVAAVPVVLIAEQSIRRAADGMQAAAASLRPRAAGTSATRCGLCGSSDHTMLDPRCPAARSVG